MCGSVTRLLQIFEREQKMSPILIELEKLKKENEKLKHENRKLRKANDTLEKKVILWRKKARKNSDKISSFEMDD